MRGELAFRRQATDEEIDWACRYLASLGSEGREVLEKHRRYCERKWKHGRRPLPFAAWIQSSRRREGSGFAQSGK